MNVLKSSERSPEPTLNQVSRFNYAVDFVNRIVRSIAFIRLRLHNLPCSRLSSSKQRYFRQKGKESKTACLTTLTSLFSLWIDPALCTEYALSHVSFMAQSLATYQKEVSSHKTVLLLHQLNDTKYLCTSRQISDGRLL